MARTEVVGTVEEAAFRVKEKTSERNERKSTHHVFLVRLCARLGYEETSGGYGYAALYPHAKGSGGLGKRMKYICVVMMGGLQG